MDNEILLNLRDRIKALEISRGNDLEVLNDIREKVNSMHDNFTRYKGFLGALTFLGSTIIVAIELSKDWLLSHWK